MRWLWLFVVGFCFATPVNARETLLVGRVVGVHDGDTITVLTDGKKSSKIRLNGIDAPETKQPFGARAKEELSGLVFGKTVEVTVQATDRYGRTVGRVRIGDVDVNLAMVRAGMAWWYRAYARGDKALEAAEAEARASRRGLWSEKDPTPPWEWRKKRVSLREPVFCHVLRAVHKDRFAEFLLKAI